MLSERHSRHHTFPLLSPTFCSHQLWTPLYLDRVTINQKNYHHYLKRAISSLPHCPNTGSIWTKKYGDNGFFLHKNMPVEQKYDKTLLLRSDVRPWDQVVPRPMTTPKILEKESHLPFPSYHPYTSHISQFAMFPDSKISNNISQQSCLESQDISATAGNDSNDDHSTRVDAAVQTDYSCFDQSLPNISLPLQRDRASVNIVKSKAFSSGARIELLTAAGHTNDPKQHDQCALRPGIYRWDISRALPRKLQSSMTYPAPSTIYSPSDHPMAATRSFLNPSTSKTLHSVNTRVATSTVYSEHYSKQSRQIFSREILPPSDYRGKYARLPQFSSVVPTRQHKLDITAVGNESKLLQQKPSSPETSDAQVKSLCDQATQVDEADNDNGSESNDQTDHTADELHLNKEGIYETHVNVASPTESYLQPSSLGSSSDYDYQEFLFQPEQYSDSVLDRRPYSKTEALRHFHIQHPKRAPDLREFSISQGRRHVINGYHAHYWH